jgi:hypothetical protein
LENWVHFIKHVFRMCDSFRCCPIYCLVLSPEKETKEERNPTHCLYALVVTN